MQKQIRFTTILLLLFVASTSPAATPGELSSAVSTNYRITIPGFFGDFKAIGNVLTPRRVGLRADRPSNVFKPNVVNNHQLVMAGGGNLSLGDAHNGALKPGERLYLYGVSTGDNYLQLDLHTVATYVVPGMRGPTTLQTSLRFQYDDGLAGVTTRQLLDDISEWLDTEEEPHSTAKPRGAVKTTRTIQLGQTLEEVVTILGPPEKQVLLGIKRILVYSDLKVVFMDGKVTDAE
jgi:hypothetical protein